MREIEGWIGTSCLLTRLSRWMPTVAGVQSTAVAQGGGDGDVAAGGEGGRAVGVAVCDHRARVGGEGEQVACLPVQGLGDGPVGDPGGAVDRPMPYTTSVGAVKGAGR